MTPPLVSSILLLLATTASPASAFGGLFGQEGNPLVEITKSSTILGTSETEATILVQLEYQTSALSEKSSFGWLLPLPALPTQVNLGSALLFQALGDQTRSTFDLQWFDTTVAGALPADHLAFNSNFSYCTQDMLNAQCKRSTKPQLLETAAPSNASPSGNIDVADYFGYELLTTAEAVHAWLELHSYILPHQQSNHSSENDWWLEEAQWQDMLEQYLQDETTVFMALQLEHPPNTILGSSQPIRIQYELPPNVNTPQRLPLEMSALTAAVDATFEVFALSPNAEELAMPINFLNLDLDETSIGWMKCQQQEDTASCFRKDLIDRLHQASLQLQQAPILTTEYAAPLQDISLSVPEGLTIILAASTTWLGFLTKLKAHEIPPVPLVLEIIDKYVPPSGFWNSTLWTRSGGDGNEEAWVVQACWRLHHLQEAPSQRTVATAEYLDPTLKECYDLYQLPSADWSFDAQALASELDNRVFQPFRKAQEWMRTQASLTRLLGRLDGAAVADPYLALVAAEAVVVPHHYRAKAAAVCDGYEPLAIELTTIDDRIWQPAQYATCEWLAAGNVVLDLQEGTTIQSIVSVVHAWGGVEIKRNETGGFDPEEIAEAVQTGEAILRDLLDGKPVVLDDVKDQQQKDKEEEERDSTSSSEDEGDRNHLENTMGGTLLASSAACAATFGSLWWGALLILADISG